jgi:hypothetical protein
MQSRSRITAGSLRTADVATSTPTGQPWTMNQDVISNELARRRLEAEEQRQAEQPEEGFLDGPRERKPIYGMRCPDSPTWWQEDIALVASGGLGTRWRFRDQPVNDLHTCEAGTQEGEDASIMVDLAERLARGEGFEYPPPGEMTPAWVEANAGQLGMPVDEAGELLVPADHFLKEYLAKSMAYFRPADSADRVLEDGDGPLSEETKDLLVAWGYDPASVKWLDGERGLGAFSIEPRLPADARVDENGDWMDSQGRAIDLAELPPPILTFRGTEFGKDGNEDLVDDLHPSAIGFGQFAANDDAIRGRMQELDERWGNGVDVTGHSLGGALAGMTAGNNTDLVNSFVGFNPAGVDRAVADRAAWAGVESTNYTRGMDVVSVGGESLMAGDTYRYHAIDDNDHDLLPGMLGIQHHLAMNWAPRLSSGGRIETSNNRDRFNWNMADHDLARRADGRVLALPRHAPGEGYTHHPYTPGQQGHDPTNPSLRASLEDKREGLGAIVHGLRSLLGG